jgi:hypothetical protein
MTNAKKSYWIPALLLQNEILILIPILLKPNNMSARLTKTQETIKNAVLDHILQNLLQQDSFTSMMLTSRQIVKVFRINPRRLCALRLHGLIPHVKKGRVYHYNVVDMLDLLTQDYSQN